VPADETGSRKVTQAQVSEERYRERWKWDKVAWVSHCVDCYPGNCPYRVYVRDGKVLYEEAAGTYETIEPGVPDLNPMGCQKGAMWGQMLYSKERILHPLKRVGKRGEGRFTRVSWDEALTDVADGILDAIQEQGPQSIINEMTGAQGGPLALGAVMRFVDLLGGVSMDLEGVVNDFAPGMYITFGKIFVSSVDDWFQSDLIFIWHMNPAYTRIPYYHYISEARYKGAEIVTVSPDVSPSAIHADYHVPVRTAADAALALGMAGVIVDERLYDAQFVKEQTDLPLLVRLDNRRYLRESDVRDGGREDVFYFRDRRTGQTAEASRETLSLGAVDPALEERLSVVLKDGEAVEVAPVFELLRERLRDYTPEKASELSGVHPEVIRTLARKVAAKRTRILLGFNSGKQYHGDLMERAMCLLLGLTGNWGKKGTGIINWSAGPWPGLTTSMKLMPGSKGTETALDTVETIIRSLQAQDPSLSRELAVTELATLVAETGPAPPAFYWYHHCGYRDVWNRSEWNDPSMRRSFDEYFQEAIEKGWWRGHERPDAGTEPRVYIECGGNSLRRVRGGQNMLLRNLWPKLKLVVFIDWRMNTTGMYADIVLPAATHAEKMNFHFSTAHMNQMVFCDKSVEAAGEAKTEPEIFRLLSKKVAERAISRGFLQYEDARGLVRRLDDLYERYTLNGHFDRDEKIITEWVEDGVTAEILPEQTSLDTFRRKGFVRFQDWGHSPMAVNQGSEFPRDETHSPLRHHVEKKLPYPTLTRRAQFYIDHDWFLEAGEELPVHKDVPKMGGDYPLMLTSGHPRWSIHSANVMNELIQPTHQGRPFAFVNPEDAAERGIYEGDLVRAYNDMGEFRLWAKISPAVRPGQLIVYNGFEPLTFPGWKDPSNAEPGMVKWLHLAGGYGHLRFRPMYWQPCQVDRCVRLELERVTDGSAG